MRKRPRPWGKLSVEIVGKDHDMNYKKVMRYIRLNSLVPELLDKVGHKADGLYACGGDLVYQAGKPAADCRFH